LVPPNAELAQWVSLGIYDIVTSSADSLTVISNTSTIADALRWTGHQVLQVSPDAAADFNQKSALRIVEKPVPVPMSARPVLIVVAGVADGVGTTTTATGIAQFLTQYGTVALGEYGSPALAEWQSALSASGLTLHPDPAPTPLDLVRQHQWAYVIADVGAPPPSTWTTIVAWEPDLVVLVGPGDAHRLGRWRSMGTAAMVGDLGPVMIRAALVGGKPAETRRVAEALRRDAHWDVVTLPAASAPRKIRDAAWRAVLAPVIPNSTVPTSRWRLPTLTPLPRRRTRLIEPPVAASPTPEVRVQISAAPPRWTPHPGRWLGLLVDWILLLALIAGLIWALGAIAAHGLFPGFTASYVGRMFAHASYAETRWLQAIIESSRHHRGQ
jgi:hypothetical protein